MRRSEFLLTREFLIGISIWITILVPHTESLRGSAVVLQAKTKLAEPKVETGEEISNNGSTATNVTKPQLTGIPQIDYVLDPNLPRELNGHNLTDYPFYNAVPDEIDFKCDGLHDGFYASVPHKCQVYHHCLFGTRYDFLCANYTAFDQKTFICHFVSEVDCANSPKYFKRNEALYKEATTTSTTTTTTSTTPSTTSANPQPSANGGGTRHGNAGRRRRPYYRRRRPMYEYYYDDDEYVEPEYYEDDMTSVNHRRNPSRKQNKDNYDSDADYDSHSDQVKPSVRTPNGGGGVYDRPRTPPKIRRPVPKSERDKYEYTAKASTAAPTSTEKATTSTTVAGSTKRPSTTQAPSEEYYDDDDEEYEYDDPKPYKAKHHQMDYDIPTGYEETRRYVSRHRSRMPVRKRTDMYDDYDMKDRPRMNRRKEYTRYENDRSRNTRPGMYRSKEQGIGYKKHGDHRRRPEMVKRPIVDDDYYYDDEEEEPVEPLPKRNRRPPKTNEKAKPTKSTPVKTERIELKQFESTTKYQKPSSQRTAKANYLELETPKENEIPTTERLGARTTLSYKTVKIVNNSLRDDVDESDGVSTEETKTAFAHAKPSTVTALPKVELRKPFEEVRNSNRSVTPLRHFVITTPIRKPSHFGFLSTPANVSFREDAVKLPERKPLEFYKATQFIKIPVTPSNQNISTYQGINFGSYFIPIERKVKPVEERLPDNLNVISNGITYNNAFITEPKPFDTSKTQPYRQEHRLYTIGDRLYTNSISFPHQPPLNYDVTAPGPSAPAEEMSAPEKKYSDLPAYTSNTDYDVTYNDALQPSTLHPVRRFPSTTFYVQNQRRLPAEYTFNESAFNSLNRSQNRYK